MAGSPDFEIFLNHIWHAGSPDFEPYMAGSPDFEIFFYKTVIRHGVARFQSPSQLPRYFLNKSF